MQEQTDLKNLGRPIRVGVILLNSITEILDVAPIDIFHGMLKAFIHNYPPFTVTDKMRTQALDVEFHWVNESGEPARLTAGGIIKPTHTFADCPPLDIALMGAHDSGYSMSPAEVRIIQKTHEDCHSFLFICDGFQAGLQAGLLEGKTATALRPMMDHLRRERPEVRWVEKRWAHGGKVWTSGALLDGLDMMKAFVMETFGAEEDSLAEFTLRVGAYPYRDVDYADVPWKL